MKVSIPSFFLKPTMRILENNMKSSYDLKDLFWKATFPKRRKLSKTYLHGETFAKVWVIRLYLWATILIAHLPETLLIVKSKLIKQTWNQQFFGKNHRSHCHAVSAKCNRAWDGWAILPFEDWAFSWLDEI